MTWVSAYVHSACACVARAQSFMRNLCLHVSRNDLSTTKSNISENFSQDFLNGFPLQNANQGLWIHCIKICTIMLWWKMGVKVGRGSSTSSSSCLTVLLIGYILISDMIMFGPRSTFIQCYSSVSVWVIMEWWIWSTLWKGVGVGVFFHGWYYDINFVERL